jgi:Ca2+-transporting ATPase
MSIELLYDAVTRTCIHFGELKALPAELIEYAMWASETNPFDPMEKAIYELYKKISPAISVHNFTQVHEYPIRRPATFHDAYF